MNTHPATTRPDQTGTANPGSLHLVVRTRRTHALYRAWRDASALADQLENYGHRSIANKLHEAASDALESYEKETSPNTELSSASDASAPTSG